MRVLSVLVISVAFFGCDLGGKKTVPDYLVGVWNTEEPRYKDRIFELKKDKIIFGTGGVNQSVNSIRKVKRGRKEMNNLFIVLYRDSEGQKLEVSFYYYPENNGVIKFKNQRQIAWKKVSGGGNSTETFKSEGNVNWVNRSLEKAEIRIIVFLYHVYNEVYDYIKNIQVRSG